MNRFRKYIVLLLVLGCSFEEAAGSPEDSFIKLFFHQYLTEDELKISSFRAYISEHDIKGTSVNDIIAEWGADNPYSFICGTPVTYRGSTLEILKQFDPEADTGFILNQIRNRGQVLWDRNYMRRLTGVKIISRLRDPTTRPIPFLHELKSLFDYSRVIHVSTPIFTADKRYVIIERSSNFADDSRKTGGIFLFKRDKDHWSLIAKVIEA